MGASNGIGSPSGQNDGVWDQLSQAIPFLFSWILVMPIAVIFSGKLLASRLRLPLEGNVDFIDIRIPLLFRARATRAEAVFGFGMYFLWFTIAGFAGGKSLYAAFKEGFGIDPGQWNSLCITGSLISVVCSFLIFLLLFQWIPSGQPRNYDRIIEQLGERGPGGKIDLDDEESDDVRPIELQIKEQNSKAVGSQPSEINTIGSHVDETQP